LIFEFNNGIFSTNNFCFAWTVDDPLKFKILLRYNGAEYPFEFSFDSKSERDNKFKEFLKLFQQAEEADTSRIKQILMKMGY